MSLEKEVYAFVKELEQFDYSLSGPDPTWKILFKNQKQQWNHLHISKYRDTFYIHHINGEYGSIEVVPDKSVEVKEMRFKNKWCPLIISAQEWMKLIKHDWIKTNRQVQEEYPLKYRYGTVPHSLIRASFSNIYRLDTALGKTKTLQFIRMVEEGFFNPFKKPEVKSMTANKYFEYCKIAYIAAEEPDKPIDSSLSGREMYQRFADGRHEGLLDIDPYSEQEFADWLDEKHPKRIRGGHPWEIKRGGSFTHIGMRVQRPYDNRNQGFEVELYGHSLGRLVETINMFLAINEKGLPIHIVEPEAIRKRLLGQDKIGIVPSYSSLNSEYQHFDAEDDVFETMYYSDLGRQKQKITPFIRWDALPIFKMRAV